jgi:hypothetical protein
MDLPLPPTGDKSEVTSSAQLRPAWFIALLALIDRTVLPRRMTVSNGWSELSLGVAEGRARLLDGAAAQDNANGAGAEVASRLADLCSPARPLKYSLAASDPQAPTGYSIAELVNAQAATLAEPRRAFEVGSDGFGFDADGWPLAMPEHAGAQALIASWRTAIWTRNWHKRSEAVLGGNMLMVATVGDRPHRWAIHSSQGGAEISAIAPEDLGRLVSRWRAHSTER